MKLNELLSVKRMDNRGVSPVVGVALLIAIAVILATVIGLLVFGIGPGATDAPQAKLSAQYNTTADSITISHRGGDALPRDQIKLVLGDGSKVSPTTNGFSDGALTAGESFTQDLTGQSNDDVTVVWQDPGSDSETVLAEFHP